MKQKLTDKIILYSCGDSNKLSTWSNVPYLFAKSLEHCGISLVRVDISPNKFLNRIFNTISFYVFRRLLKMNACPEFHRTWLHRFIIYRRLKKVAKQYPEVSLNLFLSYGFINPYSNAPSVLWCDWTDEIVIQRLGRSPKWYEKNALKHERNTMQRANAVYTMFPKCCKQMTEMYGRQIDYLHRNVVNTVYEGNFDISQNSDLRRNSNIILFIGNHRYKGAALKLWEAFKHLPNKTTLELHIIGMTKEELKISDDNVYCYGYLSKDDERQRDTYYRLLLSAKLLSNPAAQWGGYSSTIEAMYYGCPIVIAPYSDFVEEFGENISFGAYVRENDNLSDIISSVINSTDYIAYCHSAHNTVADYTWDNYMKHLLQDLRSKQLL